MTIYELPISESDRQDTELRIAQAAGWRRVDLRWEQLQEIGNACYESGDAKGAAWAWRRAWWIAILRFSATDPRRVTSLANVALADRQAGRESRARKRFKKSCRLWENIDGFIENMTVARRARSSLFHLRMEALHWDTYQDNIRIRFRAFASETADALKALEQGKPVTCRLYGRWRGEKPSVYDDTRIFLSAALLIGGGADSAPAEPSD